MIALSWPKADADHILVSAAEMAAIEREMVANGMPVASLMEKVGKSMAAWLLNQPTLLAHGVFVVVGPGHNGGDGLVLARELYLEKVEVSFWCPLPIRASLTKKHLAYANWLGINQFKEAPDVTHEAFWVDALLGLGQSRAIPKGIGKLFLAREKIQPGKLLSC